MSRSIINLTISPRAFICPVSLGIPVENPVSTSCCHAILECNEVVKKFLSNKGVCPCCREPIKSEFPAASELTQSILRQINRLLLSLKEDAYNLESLSINFSSDFMLEIMMSFDKSQVVQSLIEAFEAQHPPCENMPFDLRALEKIVRENKLDSIAGRRFFEILKHNPHYLNFEEVMIILMSSREARAIVQKNLIMKKDGFYFYDVKLRADLLKIEIDGKSIQTLLSKVFSDYNELAMWELEHRKYIQKQYETVIAEIRSKHKGLAMILLRQALGEIDQRQLIEAESQAIFFTFFSIEFLKLQVVNESITSRYAIEREAKDTFRDLFFTARKNGLFALRMRPKYEYLPHPSVNQILQEVVYGNRAKVREMLDEMKNRDPALLAVVLRSVATKPVKNYCAKEIEKMTLLQAAIADRNVAVHDEAGCEGMCEIIQSYFDTTEKDLDEIAVQYAALFERDLCENYPEVTINAEQENDPVALYMLHCDAQKKYAFNFDEIIAAIDRARAAPDQLENALRKVGAAFFESDEARRKENCELTLTESLNRFREKFEKYALSKIIINPYDLLHAYEHWELSCWNEKQINIFLRQVIGFVQRYLSASDASIFASGIYSVVVNKEKVPDHFAFKFMPGSYLYPLDRSCSGLGFDSMVGGGTLVAGTSRYASSRENFKNLILRKKWRLLDLIPIEQEPSSQSTFSYSV